LKILQKALDCVAAISKCDCPIDLSKGISDYNESELHFLLQTEMYEEVRRRITD